MPNVVRKVVPVVLLLFFFLSPNCSSQKSSPQKAKDNPIAVNWLKYDDGLKLAKKENKKIMVFFYTNWCGYCRRMDRYTYKDDEVKKILAENFISVRVNGESKDKVSVDKDKITERELASKYVSRGYPTTWFLEPDGEKLSPMIGYRSAEEFATVLTYVAGEWYKEISFQDYLKKKDQLTKNKK